MGFWTGILGGYIVTSCFLTDRDTFVSIVFLSDPVLDLPPLGKLLFPPLEMRLNEMHRPQSQISTASVLFYSSHCWVAQLPAFCLVHRRP